MMGFNLEAKPEVTGKEWEMILSSPYFFECPDPKGDQCLECEKRPLGTLFLWYAPEDIGSLGYLCKEHFLQNYLERWRGNV